MTTSLWDRVDEHVTERIARLQSGYLRDEPGAVSDLAKLRRGVSQELGADIELVALTISGLYDEDARLSDTPTEAEHAVYAAIVLYAVHQQSQRNAHMHQGGYSLGRSARLLGAKDGVSLEAVRRRFNALGTAREWPEIVRHSRGLIQQFRAFAIPLDYGRFARDLLSLRHRESADRVRLAWGRDFYRVTDQDAQGAQPASANAE